ncbi:MAG: 50S ribosomal protein L17 [Candidatus Nealsonbacteria bacterium RIFOXYB1_FULL_40_15]|uniref:50S ribosomal protein L17 n=2 Tax=Candidatus Nealsoniibacteriota TaxID=1817911 RepID=A0A1G2ELM3_9BACT|nr:MAG: 50S ribosomal protein L17 [Candidatus Nealsonbacteria bacterium RIFOXYC1_FULL_40_7]OGZ27792.1 MAG: 50S ribosomal protein L17 [Candidatus Nealsonbacteria bacterium RIFOXYB1_FULL_40_15]OGZ28633.1 MAG: 50S ribosomal protein L17 [Candidatus Nealsonbacteria bacterium RIFOXYD1_FULL_39_11]
MKKLKKGRKFSRKADPRRALIRSLSESLFLKDKIKTTEAKAKELSSVAEKLITKAKKGDLSSKRFLAGRFSEKVFKKLANEIGPRYKERKGGYTRVVKIPPRRSDGARMAFIELVK